MLVTGGGSGIGAATALLLAEKGARVAICGRHDATLRATASACPRGVGTIETVVLDVGDEDGVARLFDTHTFDAVVCCAGILLPGDVFDMSTEDFEAVMRVNLMGTYFVCREAMRQMRERGRGGDIVTVSSLAGIRGMQIKFPGSFAYATSKHAVAGLSEALAVDGRPHGIRVNCISPG